MKLRTSEIVAIALVACITMATSKESDSTQLWGGATSCADATVQNQAFSLHKGKIILPTDLKFADFGLPVEITSIGQAPLSGTVHGLNRNCNYSQQTAGENTLHIYACSDSNQQTCAVTFTRNP